VFTRRVTESFSGRVFSALGRARSVLSFCLLPFGLAIAQPEIDLERLYDCGNTDWDRFSDVFHCANGDYLLSGSFGTPGRAWLMRLDQEGEPRWSIHPDGSRLTALIEADNGDAVSTGVIPARRLGAIRVNRDGEVVWTHDYMAGGGASIIELKQGDFIVGGASDGRAALIRINSDGEAVWSRLYGNAEESWKITSIREAEDGIVTAGSYMENDIWSTNHGWIQKVAFDNGDVIWSRDYLFNGQSFSLKDMVSTPDGFALGGVSEGFILQKIDNNGELISQTRLQIDERYPPVCYGIDKYDNGGFIFVGYRHVDGFNAQLPIAVRTNSEGVVEWIKRFPDENGNVVTGELQEVVVIDRSVAVAAGLRYNQAAGRQNDGLLIRLGPDIPGPMIFHRSPVDSFQTVLLNDSMSFTVHARDRLGNEMDYEWSVDGEISGVIDTTFCVDFPEIGVDTVSCRISNDDGVTATGWIVTVTDLFISSYSPDTLSLFHRRGTSQTFSLDTVRAVEGDPVEYQWTLIDLNNFEREETGTEASATIEFLRSGNYQMEGLAYRGESSDNAIWTVQVRSAILDFWPRSLRISVPPDSSGAFGVLPFNPESDSLTYRWELDGDSVGSDSTVTLRFVLDGFGNPSHRVSAIVMDGAEGDTVTWEVTVREPDQVGKSECQKVEKRGMLSVSPNPLNSSTTIHFTVPSSSSSSVRLTLHDLTGREVLRLVDAHLAAGNHSLYWNAERFTSGIYLIKMETPSFNTVRKVALMR